MHDPSPLDALTPLTPRLRGAGLFVKNEKNSLHGANFFSVLRILPNLSAEARMSMGVKVRGAPSEPSARGVTLTLDAPSSTHDREACVESPLTIRSAPLPIVRPLSASLAPPTVREEQAFSLAASTPLPVHADSLA